MNISDYQVHRVLKLFSKQLIQNYESEVGSIHTIEEEEVFRKLRYDSIVKKVTEKILYRIISMNPSIHPVTSAPVKIESTFDQQVEAKKADFHYALIESDKDVKLCRFSTEPIKFK